MNFKKIFSAFLVASMLVTSVFSNVGTSVYANKKQEDKVIDLTNRYTLPTQKTEKEETKEKDNDRIHTLLNDDKVKIPNKSTTDKETTLGELVKEEASLEEIDRDKVSVDLTNNSSTSKLETVTDDELVHVIIVVDGNAILDDDINASVNFFNKFKMSLIERKQNSIISKIEKKVLDGEQLDVHYQYSWLLNGIAAEVPFGMIDEIEKINGVEDVVLQPKYELDTKEKVDPNTVAGGVMIGRDDVWASGYTGIGMKIAIIDTGLDDDHQSFQAMDESKLTADSANVETIEKVLGQLNATNSYQMEYGETLTAEELYRSNKVAFAFNYVDVQTRVDHSDEAGDHGTHVAGIAGANNLNDGQAVGTAPDAQLYIMKVFGENGGAYTEDYLAAIEDAILLGADVVNLSLGAPAGFTTDGEFIDGVFEKVADTGTVLTISAGNSYTSGYGNLWGTNVNLSSNPDNGVVGSPGSYTNVTTVGSVENVKIMSNFFEVNGKKLAYLEGINAYNELFTTLANQELEFVYVGNYGQTIEDYMNAGDLTGKIALVQRGISSFVSKCELAEQAGAIGVLIYNNTTGTINMDLTDCVATIPCASITMMAGEYMLAELEKGNNTLVFSETLDTIENEDGYKMSDFSSWGVTSDLTIGPDITGPGGNIYSTLDGGTYGLMSGTSMSSPNVAGLTALVMEYLEKTYPDMNNQEKRIFVNSLLMSTATPLEYSEGLKYSPRQQGSGLANAYYAINTFTYLSVDGTNEPEAELGDDVDKTGKYEFTFNVHNFGTQDAYYDLNTLVQTEQVLAEQGYKFMAGTPIELSANTNETSNSFVLNLDYNGDGDINVLDARFLYDNVKANTVDLNQAFRYDLNQDEVVDEKDVQLYLDMLVDKDVDLAFNQEDEVLKVSANDTVSVTVTVEVTEEGKAYMDTNFENGIYVEGFTVLTALSANTIDLSLPYLAFYGDWTKAPLIDNGFYYSDESMSEAYYYYNMIYTQYNNESAWAPGLNPYVDEEFNIEYSSLSPNNDGYADYITDTYVSLIRNANQLSFVFKDEEGNVLFEEVLDHIEKSYFSEANGICLPHVYSWYSLPFDLNYENLEDNTKLEYIIHATIDYDKHEANNDKDTWVTPITIDLTAPEIVSYEYFVDDTTGRQFLDLVLTDNVATSAVNFLSKNGTIIRAQMPVDHEAEANGTAVRYEVTGYGNEFLVILGDYAFNERAYLFTTENNDPVLDDNYLYGYRLYDDSYATYGDQIYGWLSIDKETAKAEQLSSEWYMDSTVVAAEYVGGYIVAATANKDLVFFKPGYWDERVKIAPLSVELAEMTFDPVNKVLYAYDWNTMQLSTIDIYTGEQTFIGWGMDNVFGLSCDLEGNLYGINSSGELRLINKEEGYWEEEVLLDTVAITDNYPYYATQSMTYDSEENCLYWAATYYNWEIGVMGRLYKISLDTYEMSEVGTIAGNAEVSGLLMLDDKGFSFPQDAELESISLRDDAVSILVGGTDSLDLVLNPWYAQIEEIVWESANEEIVEVDENGYINGVSEGTTTVTVTVDGLKAEAKVNVIDPKADITGYVYLSDYGSLYNQWVQFSTEDMSYDVLTEMGVEYFTAGEYVDGTIYAYYSNGVFAKVNAEDKTVTKVTLPNSEFIMLDMAYDYSSGYMYGLLQDMNYTVNLVHVDLNTGNFEFVTEEGLMDANENNPVALTVSTDGTIYIMMPTGNLHEYDLEEGLVDLGYTGVASSDSLQSMTYDHNNGGIYWSMYSWSGSYICYIDPETVTSLPLNSLDGGEIMTSMYIINENVPELEEVEVNDVIMLQDTVKVLEEGSAVIPVSVLPFNATNRDVTWTVDETIAKIENGLVIGVKAGTTTAKGTLGEFEVTMTIEVLPAAGEIYAFIMNDLVSYEQNFFATISDNGSVPQEGLAATDYVLYAGEYYDGYIYGYGVDYNTDESIYMKVNATTYEIEESIVGNYPDVLDLAFDYSKGVMYAIAGARNVVGNKGLYYVDITTGNLYKVGDTGKDLMTLACTTDGTLYSIDVEGYLYKLDGTTGEATEIGYTGQQANVYQSMFYDHNTGNMYWAQLYSNRWGASTSGFYLVNPNDASLMFLGNIGSGGCEATALHTIPSSDIVAKTPEITGAILNKETFVVRVDETVTVSAKATPVSVKLPNVKFTFSSNNPEIATVDPNTGVVTGVAAGETTIVITAANGASTTCVVKVVDETTKLNVFTKEGLEVSPLLYPNVIDSTTNYATELDLVGVTYYNNEFYAVDTTGYLWKLSSDLTTAEKVVENTIQSTFDSSNGYLPGNVLDIFTNSYTNEVYVIATVLEDWGYGFYYEYYYLYQLDVTTGTATEVVMLSDYIDAPRKAEFIDEDTLVVYDGLDDYLFEVTIINDYGYIYTDVNELVWAQGVLVADNELALGMTHVDELGMIYLSVVDPYYNNGNIALYAVDYNAKTIEKVSDAAYSKDMVEIVYIP